MVYKSPVYRPQCSDLDGCYKDAPVTASKSANLHIANTVVLTERYKGQQKY